jgi:transposase-like protein
MNNRVEGDHRFIKWRIQNILGFKNFESASRTLSGIEIIRMIKSCDRTRWSHMINGREQFMGLDKYL